MELIINNNPQNILVVSCTLLCLTKKVKIFILGE